MNTRHCRFESSESHLIIIIFIYSCSTQHFNKIADFYSKKRIGIKQNNFCFMKVLMINQHGGIGLPCTIGLYDFWI